MLRVFVTVAMARVLGHRADQEQARLAVNRQQPWRIGHRRRLRIELIFELIQILIGQRIRDQPEHIHYRGRWVHPREHRPHRNRGKREEQYKRDRADLALRCGSSH